MHLQIPTFVDRRVRPVAVALFLTAALSGCGGNDEPSQAVGDPLPVSDPLPPPPSFPPLPTSNPDTGGGIWWGTLSRGGEIVNNALCLLVEAGELACILSDTSGAGFASKRRVGAVHGAVQFSNATQASGSGKIYATPGNVLADGSSVVADFTITGGSLGENSFGKYSQLQLTFASLGEEFTFDADFDHYYVVTTASRWPAHGVYTTFDIYGDPASLSIDPVDSGGGLFMQSESGCTGNGQMSNLDSDSAPFPINGDAYNAYTVELTVSNCPGFDGDYQGLATLIDFAWVNGTDDLIIAVFNDTAALAGEAVK